MRVKTILKFPRNDPFQTLKYNDYLAKLLRETGQNLVSVDETLTARQAGELIDFWHPDGCIVNNDDLPFELFSAIPTIFTHRDPKTLPLAATIVSYDEKAIAALAARELLSLHLASYAFVGDRLGEFWCTERQREFVAALKLNGKPCAVFGKFNSSSAAKIQEELATWIRALPKPVGIFAANDTVAVLVANACAVAKIAIPEDVSLIGVDNISQLCENAHVSISSIEFDPKEHAETVAQMLRQRQKHQRTPSHLVLLKPLRLVRRNSSARFARSDKKVAEALDLIRQQACSGLKACDVAAIFPCSRRMAEIRFRATTGHSILEEIDLVRLANARELTKDKSLHKDTIAVRCGYRSWISVSRLLAKYKKVNL